LQTGGATIVHGWVKIVVENPSLASGLGENNNKTKQPYIQQLDNVLVGLDLVAAARRQQRFMQTMLEQRGELETKPASCGGKGVPEVLGAGAAHVPPLVKQDLIENIHKQKSA
jgi:hypothetical protein